MVRMLIAHRADPRREGLGTRLSRVLRAASASRHQGRRPTHAQQSTSRFTQRLSLVYSSTLLYTCCTPRRRTVYYTRHAVSARQVAAVSLVLRTVRRTALSATRRGLSPPRSSFGRGCAGKQCAWAMRGVVSSQRGGGASKLCEQLQLVAARVGAHLTPLRRGSSHLRRSRKIPCAA